MQMNHENMIWSDVTNIKRYTEHIEKNKTNKSIKYSVIMLVAVQYMHNYIQGLKRQNAYDAASILFSDMNWMRKCHTTVSYDDNKKQIIPKIGHTYYIDYGNTFAGELGYYHHGLCIGVKDNKFLVVPIRSGDDIFPQSYHPTNNKNGNKKYRQGLMSDGFPKDCVLLINDAKFISRARIDKEIITISDTVLSDIQMQVFQIMYPTIHQRYQSLIKNNDEYKKRNKELEKQVHDLKFRINKLEQQRLKSEPKNKRKHVDNNKGKGYIKHK